MAEASKPVASNDSFERAGKDGSDSPSLWEQLKGRSDTGDEDSSSWTLDRVFATLAAVLLPLGIVAIGLAWYGSAHTPFLFEQIPYMISGGLLGLGLLTVGGLLYIGTWIARLAEEQRNQSEQLQEVLEGLREDLRSGAPSGSTVTDAAASGGGFVATPTGSMFHRRDCSIVADRSDLHTVNGQASDLQPCKMCEPLAEQPTTTERSW